MLIRGIYEDDFLNINESPWFKVLKNTITTKSLGVNIFAQIAETPLLSINFSHHWVSASVLVSIFQTLTPEMDNTFNIASIS